MALSISPLRLTIIMCLAEILGMTGFSVFPALLPGFIGEWALSNTQAGWISGILYGGYVVSVPALVSLTDRIPAKKIYIFSMALCGFAYIGFAVLADGAWSAFAFRMLIGFGLAGTYMPGLKILSDNIDGKAQSRAIAFYTACFSIGAAMSFFMAGEIAEAFDWRVASAISAIGPILAMAITWPFLPRELPKDHVEPDTHLLDFRPVFKCRAAMGYVLAYTAHNFELFNLRSWMVAYLFFAQTFVEPGYEMWSATATATFVTLLGLPSSVIGNEFSNRFGRNKVIAVIMLVSAVISCVIGFLAGVVAYPLIVGAFIIYGITVTADSASITSGAVSTAPKGYMGATMAVHSCIGFTGAFLGPLAFGIMLDVGDAFQSVSSWGLAFAVTGLVVAMGPVALRLLAPKV